MEYSKELPSYTRGEERFSGISHMAGGGIAIAGFVVGLVLACICYINDYHVLHECDISFFAY